MTSPIRIALADDHPLYLEGLEMLLNSSGAAKVIATAADGLEAVKMIEGEEFDILLLDLHIPNKDGMQIAEELSKKNVPFRIIMLTMQRGGRYIDRLKKWGVKGYVLKSVSLENLVDVIQRVHNGEEYFPEDAMAYDHEEDVRLKSSVITSGTPEKQLTAREQEILILVCQEFSSKEIGEKLFISTGTVDTHRKNLLLKLGVSNTVGLVKYALKHGLLDD